MRSTLACGIERDAPGRRGAPRLPLPMHPGACRVTEAPRPAFGHGGLLHPRTDTGS
jgi:hypothetical protein